MPETKTLSTVTSFNRDGFNISILTEYFGALILTGDSEFNIITLNWNDIQAADAYYVYRSTSSGDVSEKSLIAIVSGNTFSQTVLGISPYYYQVRAIVGSGLSSPSNEVSLTAQGAILTVTASVFDTINISITNAGDTAVWYVNGVFQEEANSVSLNVSSGDKIDMFTSTPEAITEVDIDEVRPIGIVDLRNLPSLRNFISTEAPYPAYVFSKDAIQQGVVQNYDLTNSIATNSNWLNLVRNLLIANDGTYTTDGLDFTGTGGVTVSGRTVNVEVGTIINDNSLSSNRIAYQIWDILDDSIDSGKGFNITTIRQVCLKTLNIDTNTTYYAATDLEETIEIESLNRIQGQFLQVKLFDTVENASEEPNTGVGLLATGFFNINMFFASNPWSTGRRGIRLEASDTSSFANITELSYKAFVTVDRPCGATVDVTTIKADIALSLYGLFRSNTNPNIRVLRSSDNTTQDFTAPIREQVNYAAINTFTGNQLKPQVPIVYDISGNNTGITVPLVTPTLDVAKQRIETSRGKYYKSSEFTFENSEVGFLVYGDVSGSTASGTLGYHIILASVQNGGAYQIRFKFEAAQKKIFVANIESVNGISANTNVREFTYTGDDVMMFVLNIKEPDSNKISQYDLNIYNSAGEQTFTGQLLNRLTDTTLNAGNIPDFAFFAGLGSSAFGNIIPFFFNTAAFYRKNLSIPEINQFRQIFNV